MLDFRIRFVNVNGLDKESPSIRIKYDYVIDGEPLPTAWSRIYDGLYDPTRDQEGIGFSLISEIGSMEKPVLKKLEEAGGPAVIGFELYHWDMIDSKDGTWGIAVNYYRLGEDGSPISGFSGDSLWRFQMGDILWGGGPNDERRRLAKGLAFADRLDTIRSKIHRLGKRVLEEDR